MTYRCVFRDPQLDMERYYFSSASSFLSLFFLYIVLIFDLFYSILSYLNAGQHRISLSTRVWRSESFMYHYWDNCCWNLSATISRYEIIEGEKLSKRDGERGSGIV